MTFYEYAVAVLGKFNLSESDISLIFIESGASPETVISQENKVEIKTAIYNQIPGMIAGLSDVSEGGYGIKWNIDGIKLWYSALAGELGLPDLLNSKQIIRDASNRW